MVPDAVRDFVNRTMTTFTVNRQLTFDLIDVLNTSDLRRKWPRPGLDTFAKHFEELAAVEHAFASALTSGMMDFSEVPSVSEFEGMATSAQLRIGLQEADRFLQSQIQLADLQPEVNWDGTPLSVDQHMMNLVSHEVFHQGQMAAMLYHLGIALPDSWLTNWALPTAT